MKGGTIMDHKYMNENRKVNKEAAAELAKEKIHTEEQKENERREKRKERKEH